MADLSKVDWPKVVEALDLPKDANIDEILAGLRAVGYLPPVGAQESARRTGRKPRAYLDATQVAAKHGVDLREVWASGAGGRITALDVERTAAWRDGIPIPDDVYLDRIAAELNVDQDQVAGSGPGGKITTRDIVAASRLNASLANLTTPARPQFPAGDAFRPNPLVDDLRRSDPTLHRLASAEGPPPSLFSGGDLPMTTASGLDPAILARVPWMARHAVAAARTSAEAYRIVEDTSGPDGELHAHTYADHPGVRAYEARVRNWAVGLPGQTPADSKAANREISEALAEELHGRLFPPDSRR